MQDLLELGSSRNGTRPQLVCERLQGCNFEKDLDLVDRISLRRHADTKTIVAEGRVAVVVDSLVYVAVVVVVEWDVPVALESVSGLSESSIDTSVWVHTCDRSQFRV